MVKLTIRTSTSQPAAEKKTSPKNRMRWNGGLPPLLVSLLLLLHQPFAKPIQAFTSTTSNTATFSPATINPANKNGRQQQQRQQQHHRALFLQPSQFAATASEAPRSGGWSNSLTPHHYQKQVFSGATTFPPVKRRTLLDGHYSSRSSSSTARTMIVDPATAGGMLVLAGAISGGLFSGGLHAIAGPDHLAALLPRCCGQRWYRAGRVGALWGMGHGISATCLGVIAFALKKGFCSTFQKHPLFRTTSVWSPAMLSTVMEVAVGLSLILIGVMGMREAREWKEDDGDEEEITTKATAKSLSAAAVSPSYKVNSRAVVLNGLLHGLSWDGAPSLAPALALATWSGNLAFLSAYAIGTMSAMAIVTTLIGEGTRRAGKVFQRPDIPQKLSYVSSLLAIVIGVVWCGLGLRR